MQMIETAVFAGGCFWCTEAIFQNLRGVTEVRPGYTGGDKASPTYQQVSSGKSGHAEAVQIKFNSTIIGYETLLEVFFHTHDPTQLNKQGSDVGEQYRSVVFYTDDKQRELAEKYLESVQKEFSGKIVTKIEKLKQFFEAAPYCKAVIDPKIKKFFASYKNLAKTRLEVSE